MAQLVPVVGVGHFRRGFTLLEMLVVLIIVGILSVMAYSGWEKAMWMLKAKGSADHLRNSILLARSDAMARRHNSGFPLRARSDRGGQVDDLRLRLQSGVHESDGAAPQSLDEDGA